MSRRERNRRRRRGGATRSKLGLSFVVMGLTAAIASITAVGYVIGVAASAPPLSELKPFDQGTSSVVLAADGSRLGYIESDEIRTPVPLRDIPDSMRAATIAIEDERFYEHSGVDMTGIVRAAVKNVQSGRTLQGGSTITQQLVRNLYISNAQRDLERKIREARLAEELENRHPGRKGKDWILGRYLNSVSYGTVGGRTATGVEAAAQTYFSKHAKDLNLEETAMLAGLPQAPSQYNPFQNPSAALERRNSVLQKMARLGYITHERAERAYATGLRLKRGQLYTKVREPFFFDYVKQELIERYGVNTVRKGGLTIQTTIDPRLQKAGREAIAANLSQPGDPSSALVAVDPRNGYIRAMSSSATYKGSQFNLAAQGHRQPGSAFKTFVLAAAIRRGVNPYSTSYVSRPLQIPIPGSIVWKVQTYDNTYGGSMNLVRATLRSDNSVYAQLDLDIGPDAVRQTAYDMGVETKLDAVPAEGLGGLRLGVSPLEMANAYATLASGGIRNTPIAITRVKFAGGKVEELGKPKRKRIFSDAVAYEVTKILKQNITGGTGGRAQIGCPQAGKTGTTDNFNDAWFVGYTPRLSASVWVGYPDALREMRNVHGIQVAGGTFPAQIWGAFMKVAKGGFCADFPQPQSAIEWKPFTGKYSRAGMSGAYTDPTAPVKAEDEDDGEDEDDEKKSKDRSAGGKDHTGYDPRLYAPGAGGRPGPKAKAKQPEPEPEPPAPAPEPEPPTAPPAGEPTGGGTAPGA